MIMDTLKSGQPPYNGQTVHPLPIYCPYISTSEEWTKCSSPMCPLSTVLFTPMPHYFMYSGSPRYFGPLLDFLRSGVLEIPPGVSHTALQREAKFYGLSSVVTDFKQQEEEKRKINAKESEPIPNFSATNFG